MPKTCYVVINAGKLDSLTEKAVVRALHDSKKNKLWFANLKDAQRYCNLGKANRYFLMKKHPDSSLPTLTIVEKTLKFTMNDKVCEIPMSDLANLSKLRCDFHEDKNIRAVEITKYTKDERNFLGNIFVHIVYKEGMEKIFNFHYHDSEVTLTPSDEKEVVEGKYQLVSANIFVKILYNNGLVDQSPEDRLVIAEVEIDENVLDKDVNKCQFFERFPLNIQSSSEQEANSTYTYIYTNSENVDVDVGQQVAQPNSSIDCHLSQDSMFVSLVTAHIADNETQKIVFSPSLRKRALLKEYVDNLEDEDKKNQLLKVLKPAHLHKLFSDLKIEAESDETRLKKIDTAREKLVDEFIKDSERVDARWKVAAYFTFGLSILIRKIFFSKADAQRFTQRQLTAKQYEQYKNGKALYNKQISQCPGFVPSKIDKQKRELGKTVTTFTTSKDIVYVKATAHQQARISFYLDYEKQSSKFQAKQKECDKLLKSILTQIKEQCNQIESSFKAAELGVATSDAKKLQTNNLILLSKVDAHLDPTADITASISLITAYKKDIKGIIEEITSTTRHLYRGDRVIKIQPLLNTTQRMLEKILLDMDKLEKMVKKIEPYDMILRTEDKLSKSKKDSAMLLDKHRYKP